MSLTSYCHRGAEGAESNKMHEAIKVVILHDDDDGDADGDGDCYGDADADDKDDDDGYGDHSDYSNKMHEAIKVVMLQFKSMIIVICIFSCST